MIERAGRTQIRKNLAKAHQRTVIHKQQVVQTTINAVLWSIIKGEAMKDDPDAEGDAVMTFPRADLEQIPANWGLVLDHNKETDTISIRAVLMKPKSTILLPGDG